MNSSDQKKLIDAYFELAVTERRFAEAAASDNNNNTNDFRNFLEDTVDTLEDFKLHLASLHCSLTKDLTKEKQQIQDRGRIGLTALVSALQNTYELNLAVTKVYHSFVVEDGKSAALRKLKRSLSLVQNSLSEFEKESLLENYRFGPTIKWWHIWKKSLN